MRRRTVLLGTAALLPTLAGCSGGSTDDGNPFGGDAAGGDGGGSDGGGSGDAGATDPTETDFQFDTTTTTAVPTTTTPPPARGSITGTVSNDGFEAVDLAGAVDPGTRTIEMQVNLRNIGDSPVIVSALAYNIYDDAGGRLVGASKQLETERQLAPGETAGITQTIEFGDKTDPTDAATVEVYVTSRSP